MAAAKDVPTVKVDKARWVNYWRKAEEFLEMANESLTRRNWNAAALNSVHAAISANDALLVPLIHQIVVACLEPYGWAKSQIRTKILCWSGLPRRNPLAPSETGLRGQRTLFAISS